MLRIAAFRSAALHLLPPTLERLTARHPGLRPEVRVVRELGEGGVGEVAAGRADLALATLGPGYPPPPGLLTGVLVEEAYALVHPAGHPDPKTLPLLDWDENCGSHTRDWWSAQDWLPPATVKAEDDAMVLTMVGRGLGMAILPAPAAPRGNGRRGHHRTGPFGARETRGIRHHTGIRLDPRRQGSDQGTSVRGGLNRRPGTVPSEGLVVSDSRKPE